MGIAKRLTSTLKENWFRFTARICRDPQDSEEIRYKKELYVSYTLLIDLPSSLLQSLVYILSDKPVASLISVSWAVLSFLNFIFFVAVRSNLRFTVMRAILLHLPMPILVTVALGGVINSGAYIMMSIGLPLGAILFLELRAVPYWAALQLSALLLMAVLDRYLRQDTSPQYATITTELLFNFAVISLAISGTTYYFVYQRNVAAHLLKIEQDKSEALLLNILPHDVAEILKNDSRLVADYFEQSSVLFADIVDFTSLSARLEPQALVDLLNDVFSQFDGLVERYELEKIKTIGDCYMVAAGVPRSRPDHAAALAALALDMHAVVAHSLFQGHHRLTFRIGINSGPLIAGVIGRHKFIYDLWGDTVNTASRMESQGSPGKIQITQATYELLKDTFVCAPGGTVLVKGRGAMEVWYLEGVRHQTLVPPTLPLLAEGGAAC